MSLRSKLTFLVAAVALLLSSVAVFLGFFLPARTDDLATRWAKRRGAGVANVMASAVAPSLDADVHNANDALNGLAQVQGAVYGILRRHDGSTVAAWRPNLVPEVAKRPNLRAGAPILDNKQLHFVQNVHSKAGNSGLLVLGFSLSELEKEKGVSRTLGLAVGGTVLLIGVGLCLAMIFVLARPITRLARTTADVVATGDLTASFDSLGSDEFGLLARSVGEIIHQQRQIVSRIKQLITGVANVVARVSAAAEVASAGASTIESRVEETASAADEMLASLRTIASDVDSLHRDAEDSTAFLVQMDTSNTEVASNVQIMAESVHETSSAIHNIATSIGEIARNVERLDATTRETNSAMQQMDGAIEDVEDNAGQTAALSERVSEDAQRGVVALQETLVGIQNIRSAVQGSADVIESLGKRITAIGDILGVIDDVANQTKLLSLNAAIIAAQAGEHGRGFSVVADQIKELAQRTGHSTQEISKLIHNIQDESDNAILAMRRGVSSVEEGVRLGQDATMALETIQRSAEDARSMIHKIAQATVDQARGSKQITNALSQIASTVQEMSRYSNEQAGSAQMVIESTKSMNMLTEQVRHSSEEQAHGSRRVVKSIESIIDMLTRVNRAQTEQTGSAEIVLEGVESIRGISEQQTQTVTELQAAIGSLGEEARALENEVVKFKL